MIETTELTDKDIRDAYAGSRQQDYDFQRIQQLEAELAAVKCELEHREHLWKCHSSLAARVHQSLLPGPVRHPRIDVDVRYVPVEMVGGDYCQVLFPEDSCCYMTMCDVTGHGFGPALLATRVSSEVRRLVMERLRPMEIVRGLNAFILDHFRDTELHLSFFAARFDLEQGLLTYSGAGHPGPFLVRPTSDVIEVLESQNMLVGVVEHCLSDQPEGVEEVNRGDRLLFFTDGLTETMNPNGIMLGTEGLARIARAAHRRSAFDMADGILERVARFRGEPPRDDMTLIVAELK